MLIDEILQGAGFVLNKTYRETRIVTPPKTSYVVFSQSFERRGADSKNLIKEFDVTFELYSQKPDPESEEKIEAQLDQRVIEFTKQERYFIQSEQLYQTIYEFSYIEKGA